ncbi:MAG TPA: sigma-70 family RNA polymerase sigma factor [Pseudonocardiaceae bacterium]|nr:sigma-70 family RNA polymerase sigma factor [Pseudonocardiaceae bacterium]
MDERDWLTARFEEHRQHLRSVAYRMLGSASEADDAVQEAWLRVNRADADAVANVGGWLTTIVARVSLNMLRSRNTRRELPIDGTEPVDRTADPETEAVRADSVGLALLVVLDTLTPAERIAFVLHDLFGVSFDEIAPVVEKSPAAARQLASRARRRVRGASTPDPDLGRQREVVSAFLAAARGGDFAALLSLLDPDVVLRADGRAVRMGMGAEITGAHAVASTFNGQAAQAVVALVDGVPGIVWAPKGTLLAAIGITVVGGRIVALDAHADRDYLDGLVVRFQDS